uniref:Uncharacterized protein n=1 Tax=Parascaris univalens TaxID=6257 RepID=A0A915AQ61_PARUN
MNAEPAPGYDIFRPKCGFATKEERSQKGPVLRSSRTAAAKNRVRVKHKSSPPIEKAESALSKEQKDPMKISSSMKKRHRDSADSLSSNKQRIKSSDVNDEKLPPKKSQSTPLSPSTENKWNQTSSLSRKGIQHQRPTGKQLVTYIIALSDLFLLCCAVWLTYMAIKEGERCQ